MPDPAAPAKLSDASQLAPRVQPGDRVVGLRYGTAISNVQWTVETLRDYVSAGIPANIPFYDAAATYRVDDAAQYTNGPTLVYLAKKAGQLPPPASTAGDANWQVTAAPVRETDFAQALTVLAARALATSTPPAAQFKPGRLYVLTPRADSTNAPIFDVRVRALSETELEPTGYEMRGAGQQTLVRYDLATDATTALAGVAPDPMPPLAVRNAVVSGFGAGAPAAVALTPVLPAALLAQCQPGQAFDAGNWGYRYVYYDAGTQVPVSLQWIRDYLPAAVGSGSGSTGAAYDDTAIRARLGATTAADPAAPLSSLPYTFSAGTFLWVQGTGTSRNGVRGSETQPYSDLALAMDAAQEGDTIIVKPGGGGRDVYGRAYYATSLNWSKNVTVYAQPGVIFGGSYFQLSDFGGNSASVSRELVGGEFLGRVLVWRQQGVSCQLTVTGARFTGLGYLELNGSGSFNDAAKTTLLARNCLFDSKQGAGGAGPVQLFSRDDMGPVELVLDNCLVASANTGCITATPHANGSRVILRGTTELRPGTGQARTATRPSVPNTTQYPEASWLVDQRPAASSAAPATASGSPGYTAGAGIAISPQNVISTSSTREFRLSQSGVPDDAGLAMESQQYGTDGTAAIQAVLDKALQSPITVIWDTRTLIATGSVPLRVRSNTTIKAVDGCGYLQATNSSCFAILNANPVGMHLQNGVLALAPCVDENISIDNLIGNFNGFLGTTAQQLHDVPGRGWTIGVRMAGVRNLKYTNNQHRNQATFSAFFSNCEQVYINNLDVRANNSLPVNSDGIKIMCCRNVLVDKIAGKTGDDILSVVSNDGLFPTSHTSPGVQGGVDFFDPYAVYGPCVNVHVREVVLDGSGFGVRLMSNDQLLDNIRFDRITGTCRTQWLIMDNFAERPAENYQSPAFSGNNAPGGGNFGRISFGHVAVACETVQYYPANALVRGTAGGRLQSFTIDYLERRRNVADNFPALKFTGLAVDDARVNGGLLVPDDPRYNAFVEVGDGAVVNDLWLSNIRTDRSAWGRSSGPIARTTGTGLIHQIHGSNLAGRLTNYLLENETGTLEKVTQMGASVGTNVFGFLFVGAQKTVDVTASCYDQAGNPAVPFGGQSYGTMTGQRGDAFGGAGVAPVYAGINIFGSYEENDAHVKHTANWLSGAGTSHSPHDSFAACLYTATSGETVTVNFKFTQDFYFEINTILDTSLGHLVLTLNGTPAYATIDQSRAGGSPSGQPVPATVSSAPVYTSPRLVAGAEYTLIATTSLTGSQTGIWDMIRFYAA